MLRPYAHPGTIPCALANTQPVESCLQRIAERECVLECGEGQLGRGSDDATPSVMPLPEVESPYTSSIVR